MKSFLCALFAFAATLVVSQTCAYAAEPAGWEHYDTNDYCLSGNDVTIGLSELSTCPDYASMLNVILNCADPRVLVRDNSIDSSQWLRLDRSELYIDFSSFYPEENAAGYPVVITAPSLTEGLVSQMYFAVYVINDFPPVVTAQINFLGTDIPAMTVDVTYGCILTYSQLPIPSAANYRFSGWYSDIDLTQPFLLPDNADFAQQQITGDIDLYPMFVLIQPEAYPTAPIQTEQKELEEPPEPTETVQPSAAIVLPESHDVPESHEPPVITQEPEVSQQQTEAERKETVIMMQISLLMSELVAAGLLSASIMSDMRVLRWYEEKKKMRRI